MPAEIAKRCSYLKMSKVWHTMIFKSITASIDGELIFDFNDTFEGAILKLLHFFNIENRMLWVTANFRRCWNRQKTSQPQQSACIF